MLPERYLAQLASTLDRLVKIAHQSDQLLRRLVPACPGWTLNELFGHLGSVERWGSQVLLEGKSVERPAVPATGASTWFIEGVDDFLGAMAAIDPEAPCWNFGPPPRKAGFWLRRQAHEHTLHLIDACQATDLEMPALDEDFMVDGIDEVLTMLTPFQLRHKRMPPLEAAVTFNVPGAASWTLGEGPALASISAPLQEMYCGLWDRTNLANASTIDGDTDLALRILQGPLTP